jgi:uncharacterized protein YgbK (DUF1537 family)
MISRAGKSGLFATLPPAWPQDPLPGIRAAVAAAGRKIIVLDDDPTGTQTVHDVPVLTTWDADALRAEFDNEDACFYILTNSRSLAPDAAAALNREIALNLSAAAADARKPFDVVSRSDSTLRGHFPLETGVLAEILGPFDAVILCPFFEAGGRFTINDVHYVAESETLTPAAETAFARDAAFGYHSSNLREWVAEKSGGAVTSQSVRSISLDDIRRGGPDAVRERLLQFSARQVCVVNAACQRDLEVFVQGLLAAEKQGRRFLFRTAASFVAARLGLAPRPLLAAADLRTSAGGGLTVVGSYVPKTTEQLGRLLDAGESSPVELSIEALLADASRAAEIARAAAEMNHHLSKQRDVVVFTSRTLVTGADAAASLAIGRRISGALVELVKNLTARPRHLIAKGGITSSDLAKQGLGVGRARVLGQILPGVPVWELDSAAKFPGLPYIVFPGNVGDADALKNLVAKLSLPQAGGRRGSHRPSPRTGNRRGR